MPKKGSQFERDISVRLSRWFSRGERSDLFWRTSQSGGRATTRTKKGARTAGQYGDICATDPEAQVFIDVVTLEAKRGYNSVTVAELLDPGARKPPNKKGAKKPAKAASYSSWIEKLVNTSREAGTPYWALIHKRDHRTAMIYLPLDFLQALLDNGAFRNEFDKVSPYVTVRAHIGGRSVEFMGIHLEDFFKGVSSDHIYAIHERRKSRRAS